MIIDFVTIVYRKNRDARPQMPLVLDWPEYPGDEFALALYTAVGKFVDGSPDSGEAAANLDESVRAFGASIGVDLFVSRRLSGAIRDIVAWYEEFNTNFPGFARPSLRELMEPFADVDLWGAWNSAGRRNRVPAGTFSVPILARWAGLEAQYPEFDAAETYRKSGSVIIRNVAIDTLVAVEKSGLPDAAKERVLSDVVRIVVLVLSTVEHMGTYLFQEPSAPLLRAMELANDLQQYARDSAPN